MLTHCLAEAGLEARHMKRTIFSAAATGLILSLATPAHADVDVSEPSPTAKGITGGALLGAELVLLTESALGVEPAWAYLAGGAAGALGGGIAGYFYEADIGPRASMMLLAGGMLLIIPTTVAVLAANAYEPPKSYLEDRPPDEDEATEDTDDEPVRAVEGAPDVGPQSSRQPTKSRPTRPLRSPALIGITEQSLTLSLPAIEFRERFSVRERLQYGMAQQTEFRVPLLQISFF